MCALSLLTIRPSGSITESQTQQQTAAGGRTVKGLVSPERSRYSEGCTCPGTHPADEDCINDGSEVGVGITESWVCRGSRLREGGLLSRNDMPALQL